MSLKGYVEKISVIEKQLFVLPNDELPIRITKTVLAKAFTESELIILQQLSGNSQNKTCFLFHSDVFEHIFSAHNLDDAQKNAMAEFIEAYAVYTYLEKILRIYEVQDYVSICSEFFEDEPSSQAIQACSDVSEYILGHRLSISIMNSWAESHVELSQRVVDLLKLNAELIVNYYKGKWSDNKSQTISLVRHNAKNSLEVISLALSSMYRELKEMPGYDARADFFREKLYIVERARQALINILDSLPGKKRTAERVVTVSVHKYFHNNVIPHLEVLSSMHDVRLQLQTSGLTGVEYMRIPPNDFITSVLDNIVVNSLESMDMVKKLLEHKAINIAVNYSPGQKELKLLIEDSGPGFPPHILKQIKRRKVASSKGGGSGLFSARSLIEELNGSITVDNGAEGGAKILITLPVEEQTNPQESKILKLIPNTERRQLYEACQGGLLKIAKRVLYLANLSAAISVEEDYTPDGVFLTDKEEADFLHDILYAFPALQRYRFGLFKIDDERYAYALLTTDGVEVTYGVMDPETAHQYETLSMLQAKYDLVRAFVMHDVTNKEFNDEFLRCIWEKLPLLERLSLPLRELSEKIMDLL